MKKIVIVEDNVFMREELMDIFQKAGYQVAHVICFSNTMEDILSEEGDLLKRFAGRVNMLEGNGFLLDYLTYTLYADGKSILLPEKEGKILEELMLHGGR